MTGLNYKILPSKTLPSHCKKPPPGLKKAKKGWPCLCDAIHLDSINYSLYCLANLLNQGFSNTFPSLSISYKAKRSAWMDCDLFRQWIFVEFTPKTEEFLKIFLAKFYWYQTLHLHIQMNCSVMALVLHSYLPMQPVCCSQWTKMY
jgi:DDE superfamily endonuclease.